MVQVPGKLSGTRQFLPTVPIQARFACITFQSKVFRRLALGTMVEKPAVPLDSPVAQRFCRISTASRLHCKFLIYQQLTTDRRSLAMWSRWVHMDQCFPQIFPKLKLRGVVPAGQAEIALRLAPV
jgi:hypothetical protein